MRILSDLLSIRMRKFRRNEDGAALVELAILLPVFLMLFATIIEGGRMMYTYQAVIAGVRDATRYVARVAPKDLCQTGGTVTGSVSGLDTRVDGLIRDTVNSRVLYPDAFTIGTIAITHTCSTDTTWLGGQAAIAVVSAPLTIRFPFGGIFRFAGGDLPTINTFVTDRSRIYGI